jgi:hypothetical protein
MQNKQNYCCPLNISRFLSLSFRRRVLKSVACLARQSSLAGNIAVFFLAKAFGGKKLLNICVPKPLGEKYCCIFSRQGIFGMWKCRFIGIPDWRFVRFLSLADSNKTEYINFSRNPEKKNTLIEPEKNITNK